MTEANVPKPVPARRLLALARPEWRSLSLGMLFLIIASASWLAFPQGVESMLDGVLATRSAEAIDRAALVLVVTLLVQSVASALRFYLFTTTGERVVTRLRKDLYAAILGQEVAFFDAHKTGALTSRLASDTAVLQNAVSVNVSMALRNVATALGAVVLLWLTSAKLTLAMLTIVPPIAVGAVLYGRRLRKLAREVQDALATASEVADESIAGVRTVRAFGAEPSEIARYGRAVEASFGLARSRVRMGALFSAAASFLAAVAAAVVLAFGGHLVLAGELTPGELTKFLMYTVFLGGSLGALADVWGDFTKASGAAERIFEILDRAPAMASGGLVPERSHGAITFRAVTFAYPTRPLVKVLDGLDLEIDAGQIVAVVGASGAGKSTIAALLTRLYDPDGGALLLDGADLRSLDPKWLRRHVGVVSQEPILFSTSIEENVRFGRPDATREEVLRACDVANARGFIESFPDGLDTLVGERGTQLSGGQKQRLAIARAVLMDPRVLVLDEATSALDAESEHLVKEALDRLMVGRTTLIIAHRLSTVRGADRVIVLEKGAIAESGTHDQLMAHEGPYRRLVERQLAA